MSEYCVKISSLDLITKDPILKTEYESRRRNLAIFEVSFQFIGEHLAAVLQYTGYLLRSGRWSFGLMLDRNAFYSITNCLEVGS